MAAQSKKKKTSAKKKTASKKKTSSKSKASAKKKAPAKGKAPAKKKTAAKKKSAKKKAPAKKKTSVKKKAAGKSASNAKAPAKKKAASAKESAPKKKPSTKKKTAAKSSSSTKKESRKLSASAKKKLLSRQFMMDLAAHIRDAVLPSVEQAKGREIVGEAASGDPTFKIDQVAEKALLQYLRDKKAPVAYYSEDQGYTTFTTGQPQNLLIIDPIDGTRAAKSGFEACVVSIAATRVIERPCMADVDTACVMEIVSGRTFYAERGEGARVYVKNQPRKPRLSDNTVLELMSWSMTVTARPAELIFPTAAKLIDLSSLKGGFFACNSTSYSLTRLLTNQLDACVDFANRYYRDIPKVVEDHFINAGRGSVMGIAPYDIAAALLIAEEAGCVVTDAQGKPFDDVLLLDTAVTNMRSMIAASNPKLHEMLMTYFDTRIKQYERLLERRAEALKD